MENWVEHSTTDLFTFTLIAQNILLIAAFILDSRLGSVTNIPGQSKATAMCDSSLILVFILASHIPAPLITNLPTWGR